jgi:hypothetical protein
MQEQDPTRKQIEEWMSKSDADTELLAGHLDRTAPSGTPDPAFVEGLKQNLLKQISERQKQPNVLKRIATTVFRRRGK